MLETNAPAQIVANARCRNGRNGETLAGPGGREAVVVTSHKVRAFCLGDSPLSGASRYPARMSSQRDLIEFKGERPELERPFLVVHLSGWTDSGVAGQTAMGFLQARWNARTIASFDTDELLDYRARRPVVRLAMGTIEAVTWSEIELSLGTTVDGLRDALLLSGPEPDFRWHAFADRVALLCQELGVTEVFGLGAFPAPSLHTDPVAVVSTSADPELASQLERVPAIVELAASIQSVLEERLKQVGVAATGLWARVPPYLAGGSHPPAALALIRTLERLAGVAVDVTELEAATKEHVEQVEQAIRERPQIAEFVEQIRNMVEQGADQRLPSGDEIADELERFLSQQPPPDDDNRSM